MPMKVAVDLDNTLADTTGVLIQLTNWKFNTNYTVADVDDWDFWRSKGPEMDAAFWKIYDFMETLYLRRVMPPVHPLACPVVKMLEKAGHQVSVLTANNPVAKPGIEAWLFGHGLDTPVLTMGRVSPEAKVQMDFDLFIDDSPKLIEPMKAVSGKTLILVSQPWNAKIDVSAIPNIIRAKDWREIQDILEKMGAI